MFEKTLCLAQQIKPKNVPRRSAFDMSFSSYCLCSSLFPFVQKRRRRLKNCALSFLNDRQPAKTQRARRNPNEQPRASALACLASFVANTDLNLAQMCTQHTYRLEWSSPTRVRPLSGCSLASPSSFLPRSARPRRCRNYRMPTRPTVVSW